MDNLILSSATIGIVISLLAYEIGLAAQRKWKLAILNPLLISIALVIVFLVVFHVDCVRFISRCINRYECKIPELSFDSCNSLSGNSIVSAAGSSEKEYRGNYDGGSFRSACKSGFRTGNVSGVWVEP